MASFRCYDNSDVIATLIITNFHLYLIQLWWQFFQNFVYGDVVYAQTWEVLALKNCIKPPWKFLLVETGVLDLGIRKTAAGFRNATNNWNPESRFH